MCLPCLVRGEIRVFAVRCFVYVKLRLSLYLTLCVCGTVCLSSRALRVSKSVSAAVCDERVCVLYVYMCVCVLCVAYVRVCVVCD